MQNYDIKATENGKAINITWLTNYQGEFISQERKPKVNLTTHLKAHFGQYSLSYGITIYTRDRNGNDKTIKLYTSNGNITWQQ